MRVSEREGESKSEWIKRVVLDGAHRKGTLCSFVCVSVCGIEGGRERERESKREQEGEREQERGRERERAIVVEREGGGGWHRKGTRRFREGQECGGGC